MPFRYETITRTDLDQADGVQTIEVENQASVFNISAFGATAGTLTFEIKVVEDGVFEPIIDPATSSIQTIDFSGNVRSFILRSYAYEIRVTPSGITGDYTIAVQQGDE